MPTILFPTDLSEGANQAFIYALQFARKRNARIVTLHTYQRPEVRGAAHISSTLEEFYKNFDIDEFENYRDTIPYLDRIAKENGFEDIEMVHTMIEGPAKETILARIEAEEADLVVMSTTGADALKALFQGSVAGEVMEHASCPVLTVPESNTFDGQIDHIAMATSYREEEHRVLELLLPIAEAFDAQIHVVNVDLAHIAEYRKDMELFSSRYDQPNLHFDVVDGNDFGPTLANYLEEHSVDFIAMIIHQRNFIQELFHYSRTKDLSYHTKVPVLAFPEKFVNPESPRA